MRLDGKQGGNEIKKEDRLEVTNTYIYIFGTYLIKTALLHPEIVTSWTKLSTPTFSTIIKWFASGPHCNVVPAVEPTRL